VPKTFASFATLAPFARISIGLVVVLLALAGPGSAAGQQGSNALIEKVSGGAFVRHDASAKPIKLEQTDVARRLYPGEQVRCEQGGFLRLRVAGKLRDVYGPSSWFTIPRATSSQTDPLQKALDEYGRRGGRDRGGPVPAVIVFSPSDRSVALPDLFTVRWVPSTKECETSFIIEDADGEKIWGQEHVRGTAGVLYSATARHALRKYRRVSGAGPLTLRLTDACGNETKVVFTLLAVTDEKLLGQELARWQKEPGNLTRHVGRGAVFAGYGMFPQAAEEYEAALAQAPQSLELLLRTIVAQRGVGNSAREQELTKRLPAGTEAP
jgi:hypothetical protein